MPSRTAYIGEWEKQGQATFCRGWCPRWVRNQLACQGLAQTWPESRFLAGDGGPRVANCAEGPCPRREQPPRARIGRHVCAPRRIGETAGVVRSSVRAQLRRNEFRSRADGRLSALEPERLSRQDPPSRATVREVRERRALAHLTNSPGFRQKAKRKSPAD